MAVERKVEYRCDLCGEYTAADAVKVVRVGELDDRPEACERFEVGPECASRPVRELLTRFEEARYGG
jgi:hypothetical protein